MFSNLTSFFPGKVIKKCAQSILGSKDKSGSNVWYFRKWVMGLVDAHRYFFMGHELEHAQEALEMCQNTLAYLRK